MIYVGSKSRIAKFIVPIIQQLIDDNNIKCYVEPFVGGANVIDKVSCGRKLAYDIHEGLIDIYQWAQQGWRPPTTITEQLYRDAKDGKIEEPLRSYIGFNGSYAAKYFGGFARGWKPNGAPRNMYEERTRNFFRQIPSLLDIEFRPATFEQLSFSDALIYCDPPYEGTTKYKTGSFNHTLFWDWVRQQSQNNIVLVSEFKSPADFKSLWERESIA